MDCSITTQYQPALTALSPLNQHRIFQYLAQLAAQRYAPATLRAIPLTLLGFLRTLPPERYAVLVEDLTHTTPQDITVFITVGQTAGLAPSTLNTKLSILTNVFAHLCDEGVMLRQPVLRRWHRLLPPKRCPKLSRMPIWWHSSKSLTPSGIASCSS
jgi:site-specific recombinase XerD